MTTTIRPTSPGRVMIEADGTSAYYGGALVQGNLICRISAPAAIADRFTVDGHVDARHLLEMLDFERRLAAERRRDGIRPTVDTALLSVRVLERRRVQ